MEEIRHKYFGIHLNNKPGNVSLGSQRISADLNETSLPENLDHSGKFANTTSYGVLVNPIQNQGSCGSCWAFNTVAVLESAYKMKYNQTIKLSEQFLVDCDHTNNGCDGGWPTSSFAFAKTNGINSSSNYPYVGYSVILI